MALPWWVYYGCAHLLVVATGIWTVFMIVVQDIFEKPFGDDYIDLSFLAVVGVVVAIILTDIFTTFPGLVIDRLRTRGRKLDGTIDHGYNMAVAHTMFHILAVGAASFAIFRSTKRDLQGGTERAGNIARVAAAVSFLISVLLALACHAEFFHQLHKSRTSVNDFIRDQQRLDLAARVVVSSQRRVRQRRRLGSLAGRSWRSILSDWRTHFLCSRICISLVLFACAVASMIMVECAPSHDVLRSDYIYNICAMASSIWAVDLILSGVTLFLYKSKVIFKMRDVGAAWPGATLGIVCCTALTVVEAVALASMLYFVSQSHLILQSSTKLICFSKMSADASWKALMSLMIITILTLFYPLASHSYLLLKTWEAQKIVRRARIEQTALQ